MSQKSEDFPQILFSLYEKNSDRKKSIRYINMGRMGFITVTKKIKIKVQSGACISHPIIKNLIWIQKVLQQNCKMSQGAKS